MLAAMTHSNRVLNLDIKAEAISNCRRRTISVNTDTFSGHFNYIYLLSTLLCYFSTGDIDVTSGMLPPLNEPPNVTNILDGLFKTYDKRLRPLHGGELYLHL